MNSALRESLPIFRIICSRVTKRVTRRPNASNCEGVRLIRQKTPWNLDRGWAVEDASTGSLDGPPSAVKPPTAALKCLPGSWNCWI